MCLEKDPAKRPYATELLDHEWITSVKDELVDDSENNGEVIDLETTQNLLERLRITQF